MKSADEDGTIMEERSSCVSVSSHHFVPMSIRMITTMMMMVVVVVVVI